MLTTTMHKLTATFAIALAATLVAPPAAAQDGPGISFGGQLFQGSVPAFESTISGTRIFLTGSSGLGVEAMLEMGGSLLHILTNSDVADYAAFNAQIGVVQRFVGDGTQPFIPYVAAGWYPAFERVGDVISSNTGLWYANAGAEFAILGNFGLFAEAGLGFAPGSMPLILRFGLSGT